MVSCSRCTSAAVTVDCAAAGRASAGRSATASAAAAANLMRVTGEPPTKEGAKGGPLFPGHPPADPTDPRQVVVDHGHHQHHQHDEAGQEQLLLDAHAEVAARQPFEGHDEDVA